MRVREEPRRALHDRVEHRLHVGRRAADDLQDLAVAVCCSSASFVSLNSRTFSIAITAWSAKVLSSCDLRRAESARASRPADDDRADRRRPRAAAARRASLRYRVLRAMRDAPRCTRDPSSAVARLAFDRLAQDRLARDLRPSASHRKRLLERAHERLRRAVMVAREDAAARRRSRKTRANGASHSRVGVARTIASNTGWSRSASC